jgi:hypothetical protein
MRRAFFTRIVYRHAMVSETPGGARRRLEFHWDVFPDAVGGTVVGPPLVREGSRPVHVGPVVLKDVYANRLQSIMDQPSRPTLIAPTHLSMTTALQRVVV